MKFNWVDILAISLVASTAAIQLLRGVRDLSQVFYETALLVAALVGATKIFIPLHNLTNFSYTFCFAGSFLIFAILAIMIATFLNRFFAFGFGGFSYILAAAFGVVCGFVVGHAVMRTLFIALGARNAQFVDAVHRSWMASQVLYFGAFRELLGVLRIARYNNI
ncbi:MAG: hypothetical protein ABIK44_05130 [candidate division WOR-3 bacterium]